MISVCSTKYGPAYYEWSDGLGAAGTKDARLGMSMSGCYVLKGCPLQQIGVDMHQLGDAPIEDKHREDMNRLAVVLDQYLNGYKVGQDRPVGFVLLVFPFGDRSGRCNYISNGADRRDIVTMMREQIARFEGQPDMQGTA